MFLEKAKHTTVKLGRIAVAKFGGMTAVAGLSFKHFRARDKSLALRIHHSNNNCSCKPTVLTRNSA